MFPKIVLCLRRFFAAIEDDDDAENAFLLTFNSRSPVFDLVAPAHADVLLQVFTQEAVDVETRKRGSGPAPARTYQCSASALSAQSENFRVAVSDTWQQQEQQAAAEDQDQATPQAAASAGNALSDARAIKVHVDKGELEALHMLLVLIHREQQQLPAAAAAASRPRWFRCMRLADRLQAVACLDAMLATLADGPVGLKMPADIAQLVLARCAAQAPADSDSAAAPSPLHQNLRKAGSRAMVRLYGDVPAVIGAAGLRSEFCSRPHADVLSWSRSDDLRVHSENCVVFLLSAWAQANPAAAPEQLEQLAHQVRVLHLGPAYQQRVVPALPWFSACGAMQHRPFVLSCMRAGIGTALRGAGAEKKAALGDRLLAMLAELPAGWTAKPRKLSSGTKECTWSKAPRDLQRFNGAGAYADGFMLDMKARSCDAGVAWMPFQGIRVCVGIDRHAMRLRGVPLPDHALLHLGEVGFIVTGRIPFPVHVWGTIVKSHHAMLAADRVGCDDAFGSSLTFEGLVEEQFPGVERLFIHVTFAAIDG